MATTWVPSYKQSGPSETEGMWGVLRYLICTSSSLTGFSFRVCLSPLSWGLGHLSLRQLLTSFLSFGAGVTCSIWIGIFSSHSSPPLSECLVQKKLLLFPPEEKSVPCMHFTSKNKKKPFYLVFCLSTVIPKKLVFQGFRFLILLSWVIWKVKAFSL